MDYLLPFSTIGMAIYSRSVVPAPTFLQKHKSLHGGNSVSSLIREFLSSRHFMWHFVFLRATFIQLLVCERKISRIVNSGVAEDEAEIDINLCTGGIQLCLSSRKSFLVGIYVDCFDPASSRKISRLVNIRVTEDEVAALHADIKLASTCYWASPPALAP